MLNHFFGFVASFLGVILPLGLKRPSKSDPRVNFESESLILKQIQLIFVFFEIWMFLFCCYFVVVLGLIGCYFGSGLEN